MRLGVNYVPRGSWFYGWVRLDRAAIRDDLAAIAEIGADHVRIFPLWALLQPNRSFIDPAAIDDVLTVVDEAGRAGLTVTVDALQGHLSSYDFLPSWVLSWHRRNIFTDPDVVAAEKELIRTLGRALDGHEAAEGISVGNEIIQFAAPRHPHPCMLTSKQAKEWGERMIGAAKESFPTGRHTVSFDDDLLFDPDHPFTPDVGIHCGDLITVHSWIFGRLGPALGADHPRLALLARYLLELQAAWASAEGVSKPLWLQEVGAPLTYLSAEAAPEFLTHTLEAARAVDGLEAVTWWCSHDVSRTLADFPVVEYDLGLFDADGNLKPIGRAFAEFAARKDEATPPPPNDTIALPGLREDGARESVRPDGPIFDAWASAIEAGQPRRLAVKEDA